MYQVLGSDCRCINYWCVTDRDSDDDRSCSEVTIVYSDVWSPCMMTFNRHFYLFTVFLKQKLFCFTYTPRLFLQKPLKLINRICLH